ncbi:uncharacterized protein LOC144661665 [Oculina patagonica]
MANFMPQLAQGAQGLHHSKPVSKRGTQFVEASLLNQGPEPPVPSGKELEAMVSAGKEKREAFQTERIRSMEKHARCALLPSPEKLDESFDSPGSDVTYTLEDFEQVKGWVIKEELLNADFYRTDKELMQMAEMGYSSLKYPNPPSGKQPSKKRSPDKLETGEFGSSIHFAFNAAFASMRNTASPELPELVFWYYAGHGLGKETAKTLDYSSTPCLSNFEVDPHYNDAAKAFVKELENRKVKGGELCLHEVGFCDLYGLLKPWIAAVRDRVD